MEITSALEYKTIKCPVGIYGYMDRDNNKVLKFHVNNCSYLRRPPISAALMPQN